MRPLIHGRAADVHADLRGRVGQRDERPRRGVVEAHRHRGVIAAVTRRSASSRGTAATTVHSSAPRSAPVSARRRNLRLPPTAFSSRTISRAPGSSRMSGRGAAEPYEPLQREPGVLAEVTWAGSRICARSPAPRRACGRRAAPVRARRRVRGRGEVGVRHLRDRVDREPVDPWQVEADVVARQAELVEIRAHRRCRDSLVAQVADR